MAVALSLPVVQNWSCHQCGGCCRQHAIEVTDVERLRILGQGWSAGDGTPTGDDLFTWHAGPFWAKRFRLASQPDGSCVFLDDKGLCRIHAKFGEAAKPLACRLYPYAFHPAGKKIAVSLRYSCPSAVGNLGRPLAQNASEIQEYARLVVPSGYEEIPCPRLSPAQDLDWPDFLRIVDALDASLAVPGISFVRKLGQTLAWLKLLGQAKLDNIRGARLAELLDVLRGAAESPADTTPPSRAARVQFRLLAGQYARKDTSADLAAGWRRRWALFRAAMRLARGKGHVPALQPIFREVPFDALEQPFGFPPESEELWTRYFRVKIQGLHFCGRAYFHVPALEGFQSLALIFPATLWIARWLAVSQKRTTLTPDDIAQALTISDHHHGYSPLFGTLGYRSRVRTLAELDEIPRLCAWYAL